MLTKRAHLGNGEKTYDKSSNAFKLDLQLNSIVADEKPTCIVQERNTTPMAKHLFKAGQSGNPNGRPKGSPNKKTIEFQNMLAANNFDPGEEYVALYRKQMELYRMLAAEKMRGGKRMKNPSGAAAILSDAGVSLNNICQYVYPKKKAIEHSGEVGVKTFADFIAAGAEGAGDE